MVCVTLSKSSTCFDPLSLVWVLEWEPSPWESKDIKQKNPAFWIKHCCGCHEAAIFWTYSYICYCHSPLNRGGVAKQYSNHVKFFWKQWIPVNIPLGYTPWFTASKSWELNRVHAFPPVFLFFVVLFLLQEFKCTAAKIEPCELRVGNQWEEGTQVGMLGSLMHVFCCSAPWFSEI